MASDTLSHLLRNLPQSLDDPDQFLENSLDNFQKEKDLMRLLFWLFSKHRIQDPHLLNRAIQTCLSVPWQGEAMCVLGTAVYEKILSIEPQLLDQCSKLLDAPSETTRRMAVVCLGNMVISSGSKHQPLHRRVFDLLQRVLTTEQHPIVLTSALKSMELLTNESKTMAQECTNLLSKLHQIIFTNKKPTIETRIKHPFGSDSELSDMEGPYRQHKREWQLTQNALLLLQSLVKQSPKTMYPHLGRFVHPTEPSLVQIVKGHPNEKVRIAATDVLIYFFDDSKKYMQLAAGPKKKGSFTSLSEKVAEQISVIVEACVRLIKSEIRPNVISRLFDLLNVMLLNCPFTELGSDPLPIIYDVLVDKIQDSDAIAVPKRLEALSPLLDFGFGQHLERISQLMLWALDNQVSSMQIAGYHLLIALSRNKAPLNWQQLEERMKRHLEANDTPVRISCLTALEQFVHDCDLPLKWWIRLGQEFLQPHWNDENPMIRMLCSNIISGYKEEIFQQLNDMTRNAYLSFTMSCLNDPNPDVRASGCGSIGVFIAYENVLQDTVFVLDCCSVLPVQLKDKHLNVRMRASWALGNLATALKSVQSHPDIASIPLQMISELIKSATLSSRDNEKCRAHGMRAIGNLFSLATSEQFIKSYAIVLQDAVGALVQNVSTGPFKARWNACYAIKNILQVFPIHVPWKEAVFDALCQATATSTNFKVKISAIQAMAGPPKLNLYGSSPQDAKRVVSQCMESMLKALESQKMEAGYEEQLKQAISDCLDHFVRLGSSYWGPDLQGTPLTVLRQRMTEKPTVKANVLPEF